MRAIGPVRTRCSAPSSVTIRPANSSSRSSQELSSGPPYTSTPACSRFSELVEKPGFSLNDGESVCAPRIRNGVVVVAASGCTHAMTAPSRTTTRPRRARRPLVALLEALESRGLEPRGDGGGGVVRRGRVADESGEIGEVGVTVELRHPPMMPDAGRCRMRGRPHARAAAMPGRPSGEAARMPVRRSARWPGAASGPPSPRCRRGGRSPGAPRAPHSRGGSCGRAPRPRRARCRRARAARPHTRRAPR